jgi:hypothetical protein
MSENTIEALLADLESQIRQEIQKWWNDVRHMRPENLPWFSNGIRGLARKLYYNNHADNPDWKGYRAESLVRMSLAEYNSIRDGLQTLIEEEAPAGANDAVNLLIKRLMPIIKAVFERISSVGSSQSTVSEPESNPVDNQPPAPSPEEKPPEPVVEPPKKSRLRKPRISADPIDATSPMAQPEPATEEPEVSKTSTDVAPTSQGNEDSGERSWYAKNLMTYFDSAKSKDDKEKLISGLSNVGLAAKLTGRSSKIEVDVNPSDPGSSAETIVKFFESLASSMSEDDLVKLGLKTPKTTKSLLDTDEGEAPFYHDYQFYDSLTGMKNQFLFGISKALKSKINSYLEEKVYTKSDENYVSKLKRMLAENSEENLNLVLSKKIPTEKKKDFFLNKIKNK